METPPSKKKRSSNSASDSDDWTLLSVPHSCASSSSASDTSLPTPPEFITFDKLLRRSSSSSSSNCSSSPIQQEDGLTEIDLNNEIAPLLAASSSREQNEPSAKECSPVSGFSAAETTDSDHDAGSEGSSSVDADEEEEEGSDGQQSSLTRSELDEYVNVSDSFKEEEPIKARKQQIVAPAVPITVTSTSTSHYCTPRCPKFSPSTTLCSTSTSYSHSYSTSVTALRLQRSPRTRSELSTETTKLSLWASVKWIFRPSQPGNYWLAIGMIVFCLMIANNQNRPREINQRHSSLDGLKFTPNHPQFLPEPQFRELKLLHDELSQCIKRQSPTSFKYYMSENQFKDHHQPQFRDQTTSYGKASSSSKPYRGLVCYGQESRWRKRFDQLKSEFNLDLAGLVQDTKRNLTSAIIQSTHPALQFALILDQLEYLQTLENKRNKKQIDETIKHLKAENLYLLRRLNQPSENSYQKLVVSLELKNSRLQRENEALKANLMEKAGPVYIKQSMELEQYERENIMLKQFYHQVAKDISRSLKQFNLHAMDATQLPDDHDILNSQLMITRGYLIKLGEKISQVLLENESLKEELRETYLTNVLAGGTNLQASSDKHNSDNFQSALGTGGSGSINNESKALIADGCMRNLMEARRRSKELELEVSRLESKCSQCERAGLERINADDRHLNRSGTYNKQFRQLPDSSSSTAMDKRYKDSLFLANEDIVDGLITFLNKFNHQVESRNFPIIEPPEKDILMMPSKGAESESLTTTISGQVQADHQSEMKIIPNYIREEMRSHPAAAAAPSGSLRAEPRSDVGLPINYGADLFSSISAAKSAAYSSELSEQQSHNESHTREPIQMTFEPLDVAAEAAAADATAMDDEPPSPPEVAVANKKNTTSEPVMVEPDGKAGSFKRVVRDGWFFKRAKQRRHLRSHHQRNDRKDLYGRHANWAIKRAKLREKLREKLRKAWQYIENTFAGSSGRHKKHSNDDHHHHERHHRSDMMDKSRDSKYNSKDDLRGWPKRGWTNHAEL